MKEPLSYLGPDVEIEGKVSSEGPIRIDGTCRGTIDGKDSITVGTSAQIYGAIRAQTLVVNGQIEGDLITSGTVAILSQGDIMGKIFTPAGRLSIAQGGVFQGGLRTDHLPDLPPMEQLLASQENSQSTPAPSLLPEKEQESSSDTKEVKP